MPAQAVMDAVSARLLANWTTTPVSGINLEGDTPIDGSPFLSVQYPVVDEDQITIGSPGSNVFRESGAIRFVLSIQRGQGVAQGMQWIETLRALFRGKQFAGVSTYAPSGAVLDDRNDSGNYWTLSFAVPYYFDLLG